MRTTLRLAYIGTLASTTILSPLALSTAHANDVVSYPAISGEAVFELQFEGGIDSDDKNNERDNTFGRIEVAPTVQLTEQIFIDAVAVLEPIQEGTPGENRFLDDEGIFIEEIKLNYANDAWGIYAGKFNPAFGIAWDYGRGIWSEDFAEDYEITSKIGFGGFYSFETANAGTHTLGASTFFTDTSFLSRSTITTRKQTRESDGGAGNTKDLSSFVVSLDGENTGGIENLSYHISARHLGKDGTATGKDEQGVAANVNYLIPFSDNFQSDILLEFVDLKNVSGSRNDSRYYTASVVNTLYNDWNVTVGYTKRNLDNFGATDNKDHLLQVSGGYDFGNGLTLEAGVKQTEEANVDTTILGALARYTLPF